MIPVDHHTHAQTHKPRWKVIYSCFCIMLYCRIASRGRFVPVFLLGNKWQLMIFMGRSGHPAPSVSAHIRVSNSLNSHFIHFLCPQRNFGRHIVIALSVRPSVRQSVRPSVRPSRFRVRSISPIFFEVGIPNLVCGYILGWRSVAYHFRVTVTLTLTSDLVFRIIVSGAYLLYYLR